MFHPSLFKNPSVGPKRHVCLAGSVTIWFIRHIQKAKGARRRKRKIGRGGRGVRKAGRQSSEQLQIKKEQKQEHTWADTQK
jgi:hypothetical protein